MNYTEERPWGKFENLLDSEYCKVKRITVKPAQRLSYQYHHKREEVWTIVLGFGTVTMDGIESWVKKGDVIIFSTFMSKNDNKSNWIKQYETFLQQTKNIGMNFLRWNTAG